MGMLLFAAFAGRVTVTAGVVTSPVLDHFGLVGFWSTRRAGGGSPMIAGLRLIAKF